MSAGSAAEVQETFERIIQGVASPLPPTSDLGPPTSSTRGTLQPDTDITLGASPNPFQSDILPGFSGCGSNIGPPVPSVAPQAPLGELLVSPLSPGADLRMGPPTSAPVDRMPIMSEAGSFISTSSGYGSIVSGGETPSKPDRNIRQLTPLERETALRAFPILFSFFCLATFSVPIWTMYHIGEDINVKHWITTKVWRVVFLFVPYVAAHAIHTIKGRPLRLVLVTCLVGSCIVLMLLADSVLVSAHALAEQLASQDCNTFVRKRDTELAWQRALSFRTLCARKKAKEEGLTEVQAAVKYRVHECEGYTDLVPDNPDWLYLEALEKSYRCGGWCNRGPALWVPSTGATPDSCGSAVADVMLNKVQWTALQVIIYTTGTLAFVSTALLVMGPLFARMGIEW